MATIFRQGEQVLSGPFTFEWADVRQGGPQSPGVYLDGERADFGSLAGGEIVVLTRGSTAQVGVPVAMTGATVAQCVVDINAIFGLAAGKPTDFAYVVDGSRIRLRDATVGPNAGRARVASYGAGGSINNIGLPIMDRDQTAAAGPLRSCSLPPTQDDTSNITSNFFDIPAGTRRIVVDATVQHPVSGVTQLLVTDKLPIIALGLSDSSAGQEPPYRSSSQLSLGIAVPKPGTVFSRLKLTDPGTAYVYELAVDPIFSSPGTVGTDQIQHLIYEFEVPPMFRRARIINAGSVPRVLPFTSDFVPIVGARAWAVG